MLKGTIVKESLTDTSIIDSFDVIETIYTKPDYPKHGWCLYKVSLNTDDIEVLSRYLKPKNWYGHFWDSNSIYVVYPGKIIKIDRLDKTTWGKAIDYGLGLSIPKEQLDFLIDE